MNTRRKLLLITLVLGEILLITAFLLLGTNLATNILILNIVVASLVYAHQRHGRCPAGAHPAGRNVQHHDEEHGDSLPGGEPGDGAEADDLDSALPDHRGAAPDTRLHRTVPDAGAEVPGESLRAGSADAGSHGQPHPDAAASGSPMGQADVSAGPGLDADPDLHDGSLGGGDRLEGNAVDRKSVV